MVGRKSLIMPEQAGLIKARLWNADPPREICEEFGISGSTLSQIKWGRVWADIKWPDGSVGGIDPQREHAQRLQQHKERADKRAIKDGRRIGIAGHVDTSAWVDPFEAELKRDAAELNRIRVAAGDLPMTDEEMEAFRQRRLALIAHLDEQKRLAHKKEIAGYRKARLAYQRAHPMSIKEMRENHEEWLRTRPKPLFERGKPLIANILELPDDTVREIARNAGKSKKEILEALAARTRGLRSGAAAGSKRKARSQTNAKRKEELRT